MSTLFNFWHYLALFISLLVFIGGVVLAFQEEGFIYRMQVIFAFILISIFVAVFSIYAIDVYTKEAKLYRLDSKRILSTEKIMFTGVVKNEGNYEIGEVVLEIKLVNRGDAVGSAKTGEFFKQGSLLDYFSYSNLHRDVKPQQITQESVIAKNLKPGETRDFVIYLDYPPYFSGVSHFPKIYAH
ncbi:MAG: DUF2393 family protein [Sulfurimonas sp.]|uniref:DUF2393 family protein n=1 Tax=Sulfurimonas sp. TaxID=2022749 RepID=UPI00260BC98D|nr:DUF2393 family protein [Sulfurimonas sp.]MDD5372417.1 DUF2393 family protein [Sulfurimonas sp.]